MNKITKVPQLNKSTYITTGSILSLALSVPDYFCEMCVKDSKVSLFITPIGLTHWLIDGTPVSEQQVKEFLDEAQRDSS